MSERDKKFWHKLKSDHERYAAYLERKRRERKARPEYQTKRKANWRKSNYERAVQIRQAGHAVENALRRGDLVRPDVCGGCGKLRKVEAHHHRGYEPQFWLDVIWLCVFCHRKADALQEFETHAQAMNCRK